MVVQFIEEGVGVECVLAVVNLQNMEVIQVTVAMRPLGLTRPKYQEGIGAGDRILGAVCIRIIFQVTELV